MSSLRLELTPDWAEVNRIHTRCLSFLGEHSFDENVTNAVSMVACELTENAIKYGCFDSDKSVIHLDVDLGSTAITVEVKNRIDDEAAQSLTRLDRMIQWIRGYQDPFQAYIERLKEVSTQSLESEESGLGLVRIAYEGQSVLDFYVDSSNTVSVSAVYLL